MHGPQNGCQVPEIVRPTVLARDYVVDVVLPPATLRRLVPLVIPLLDERAPFLSTPRNAIGDRTFVNPEGGAGIGSPVRRSVTEGYATPAALTTGSTASGAKTHYDASARCQESRRSRIIDGVHSAAGAPRSSNQMALGPEARIRGPRMPV